MIKPVKLYLDSILHKQCCLITDFSNLEQIGMDMIETVFAYKGVGLAANQIGLNIQMAVLNLENKTKQLIICNPKILNYSKELDTQIEGCLSAPNMAIKVQRPLWVEFEYNKLNGEKDKMRLEGFDARILGHEFAHIQGRTIVDHLMGIK